MDDLYRVTGYEHRENGCLVTFYGGEQLFFSYDEFYKYSLYDTEKPGRMTFTELTDEIGRERAFHAGLSEVLKSAKPSGEVEKILIRTGTDPEHAKAAVARLSEEGYIDDMRYAVSFVKKTVLDKNMSENYVMREASEKGIPEDKVREAFRLLGADDRESCEKAAIKKLKELKYFTAGGDEAEAALSAKDRNKLISYLAGKGFSFDVIRDVISEKTGSESEQDD